MSTLPQIRVPADGEARLPLLWRDGRDQTFSQFAGLVAPNSTGVELSREVRKLLWYSLPFLIFPVVLAQLVGILASDPLWFWNDAARRWASLASSPVVVWACLAMAVTVAATLAITRVRPPSSHAIVGSAISVGASGIVSIPTAIVVIILVANLVAAILVTAALIFGCGMLIAGLGDL